MRGLLIRSFRFESRRRRVVFRVASGIFNHCIVRMHLDWVSYWLDPTVPTQSGSLPNVFQPHAGWALPLTLETMRLESLNNSMPVHVLHSEGELCFGPNPESPATLCQHFDYFSWAADLVRYRIANEGAAEYARAMLKQLQTAWPSIVETKPMVIHDDEVRNCFTVKLSYEIRGCWKQDKSGGRLSLQIIDAVLTDELAPTRAIQRETEIYLGRPRKITRHLHMKMPRQWFGNGWRRTYEAPGLRYVNHLDIGGRSITYSKELMVNAWSIAATQVGAYNDIASELHQNVLTIRARGRFGKIRSLQGARPRISFSSIWTALMLL
jgi:hypothetical protein